MPRRDKTGPMGTGSMQGRGLGPCATTNTESYYGAGFGRRAGLGCRRGFGRVNNVEFDAYQNSYANENEQLTEEIALLHKRLETIEAQLKDKQ